MAIGQSNAGPDTSCKCKQLPILDTGMYLNGMPPIDLQCHSTLHRALNFALNCECIARAHTPKYRSHSALSPSSAAESPLHTTDRKRHTSELQSHLNLVCRLLLEKKKKKQTKPPLTYT